MGRRRKRIQGGTESEAERAKRKEGELKVVIKKKSPTPKNNNPSAMMTPAESPNLKATKLPNSFPPLKISDGQKKSLPNTTSKNAIKTNKTASNTTSKSQKKGATSKGLKQVGNLGMGMAMGIKGAFAVKKTHLPPR